MYSLFQTLGDIWSTYCLNVFLRSEHRKWPINTQWFFCLATGTTKVNIPNLMQLAPPILCNVYQYPSVEQ